MATFPIFQLPAESTKLRFKEPFGSEGLNLKSAGIVPPGIYRGYTPVPMPGSQLWINTDPNSNDSVAVVETPPALSLARFNLTVRTTLQAILDFTGHNFGVSGHLFVVIRAQYAISPSPLVGLTDAKILAVKTALNNADPQSLHDGDIKICRVTGITVGVPDIVTIIPTDRQDNGGPLAAGRALKILASGRLVGGDFSVPISPPPPPYFFFPVPDPVLPLSFHLSHSQTVLILCSAYGLVTNFVGKLLLTPVIDSVLEDPVPTPDPFGGPIPWDSGTTQIYLWGDDWLLGGSLGFVVAKMLGPGVHQVELAAAAHTAGGWPAFLKMSQPPIHLVVLGDTS